MAPRKTEAEAHDAAAAIEPIMAIEGRETNDDDKDLLVDLIRDAKTGRFHQPDAHHLRSVRQSISWSSSYRGKNDDCCPCSCRSHKGRSKRNAVGAATSASTDATACWAGSKTG